MTHVWRLLRINAKTGKRRPPAFIQFKDFVGEFGLWGGWGSGEEDSSKDIILEMGSIFFMQNFWFSHPQLPQVPHRIYIIFLCISYIQRTSVKQSKYKNEICINNIDNEKQFTQIEHNTANCSPPLFRSAMAHDHSMVAENNSPALFWHSS